MAGQKFCGEDWSKMKKKYHSRNEEDLLRYCFSSAYIVALLHDSLGVSLDDKGYVPLVAGWHVTSFFFLFNDVHIYVSVVRVCAFVYAYRPVFLQ